ncbi:programmed cell death protein 6-like protein, partial [Dimargaris cristalligena]
GSSGPPSQDTLYHWFQAVDSDKSGALSVSELQRALMNGDWSPFNIETVRMMVNMFDKDNNGTINFNEFTGLWKYIDDWKKCFQTFDADRSGTIDRNELERALRTFGFNVPPAVIGAIIRKFDIHADRIKNQAGRGTVTFDNFIQACVTVRTLTESFQRFDTNNDGWVQINYEQFLMLVINGR